MKIAIIGFGNMGRTFANGFINSRIIPLEDILIYSRSALHSSDCFGISSTQIHSKINADIEQSDIIILSVKPQDFEILAQDLRPFIKKEQVLLSVMAGISIKKLSESLGTSNIVRSMPNLPTQIGLGLTVLSASESMDRKDLFIVQNLINTTGKSIYVEDEYIINAATAVSGSGPAYVFYFMQTMIDAAQDLGFDAAQAELLVKQTFLDAVNLYNNHAISTADWINKVSSKGGTTEKAIHLFDNEQLNNIIRKAIAAARDRSVELGR